MKIQLEHFTKSFFVGLMFLVSGSVFAFPSSYDSKVYSVSELDQARAQATREKKLIIVYFGLSKVCPGCRYVEGQLDTRDVAQAFRGKYVFVKAWIGAGEDMKLARQYGITGAPQFIVLGSNGQGRCFSPLAFDNETQALALGMNLAKVTAWPEWRDTSNANASPRCLDVIRQAGSG